MTFLHQNLYSTLVFHGLLFLGLEQIDKPFLLFYIMVLSYFLPKNLIWNLILFTYAYTHVNPILIENVVPGTFRENLHVQIPSKVQPWYRNISVWTTHVQIHIRPHWLFLLAKIFFAGTPNVNHYFESVVTHHKKETQPATLTYGPDEKKKWEKLAYRLST